MARNAPTPSPAATSASAVRGIRGDHQQIPLPEAATEQPDRVSIPCPEPGHPNNPVTEAALLGSGIPDRRAQPALRDHHPPTTESNPDSSFDTSRVPGHQPQSRTPGCPADR
jgi:hypothetical protein